MNFVGKAKLNVRFYSNYINVSENLCGINRYSWRSLSDILNVSKKQQTANLDNLIYTLLKFGGMI